MRQPLFWWNPQRHFFPLLTIQNFQRIVIMVIVVDNYRAHSNVSILYVLIHLVLNDFHKVGVFTTISIVSKMRHREVEWQNYMA